MSPVAKSAELQWLAQLATMREAIAELKLDRSNGAVQEYGHDLLAEDDDNVDSGNDDIWGVFSEEEDYQYSSDLLEEEDEPLQVRETTGDKYSQNWLTSKCLGFTSGKSGLDAGELQGELSALLVSDMPGMLMMIA